MWTDIKRYSTINIRLTLKDNKTNNTPKVLRIVLTTNASFLNALAAFKSFCCTKKEYICPYTSLGTAAILNAVYSTWSDVLLVDTAENEDACSASPDKGKIYAGLKTELNNR